MTTAFGIIGSNKALQEHWINRFLAALIDGLLVFLPLFIILNVVFWHVLRDWWVLIDWLLMFLYFVIAEVMFQSSIGKRILKLKVVTLSGQPLVIGNIVIRNILRILYPLVLIDWLIGMLTEGDTRQKYMDRVAKVTVTRTDAQAYIEEQFRQMQYVPPHPQVSPQAWGQPAAPQGSQMQNPQPSQGPPVQPVQQPQTWAPTPQSNWPQHQWDEHGQLKAPVRFCSSCGGQLAARGDGKMACVRCGLIY